MLGQLFVHQGITIGLVATRLGGFVVVSPFPGTSVPRSARVGLVLLVSWFVASVMSVAGAPRELSWSLLSDVVGELSIGILVGLAFRVALASAEIAGEVAAQVTGLGSASLFNPTTQTQETAIARLFWLVAVATALATGTHRIVLGYLLETFRAVPLGTPVEPGAAAPGLVDLFASSMVMGVRLALPVIAVTAAAQVALALVARMAPALGVFQVGFPILIGAGLVVLQLSFPSVLALLGDSLAVVPRAIEALLGAATR